MKKKIQNERCLKARKAAPDRSGQTLRITLRNGQCNAIVRLQVFGGELSWDSAL